MHLSAIVKMNTSVLGRGGGGGGFHADQGVDCLTGQKGSFEVSQITS